MIKFFSSPPAAPIPPAAQADACIDQGNDLEDAGQFEAALTQYQRALALYPEYWKAHLNLGNLYRAVDNRELAFTHYQKAHRLNPDSPGACYNLGLELVRLRRPHEAIPLLRDALRLRPDFADAMVVLAEALESQKQLAESLHWLDQALALRPGEPGIVFNKLITLEKLERYEEGEVVARELARLPEGTVLGLDYLAEFSKKFGEVKNALAYYRQMPPAQMKRDTYSNYLLTLTYDPDLDPAWVLGEHRRYNDYLEPLPSVTLPVRLPRRRRRIGFISPDFRGHPVANFILKLFELLDRERYELWGYYTHPERDGLTAQIQASLDGWRELHDVRTETAAALIAYDGIDILIDLAGHTGGNRLDVLALKPAPVIATWVGYLGTTGVPAVDFRIVDGYTDPPGMTESHHTEQLIRLGHCQWCYLPRDDHPAVGPLPALKNGHITFGSFNNFVKINDAALALWAQLLARVPGSRLLIAAIPPGRSRQRVTAYFAAQGVTVDRLEFLARTSFVEYLANYNRIDIALDSFPYNGGTTTCNALYMGVPVLTLAGQHSVSRSGVSLMGNIGLPEWVAHDAVQFLEGGARLAADLPALARLRAGLRARFMASPLGDQVLFARDFATALDEMARRKGLPELPTPAQRSLPALQQAHAAHPGMLGTAYPLAEALLQQGDPAATASALTLLEGLLRQYPGHAELLRLLTVAGLQAGRFDRALAWAQQVLALVPGDVYARWHAAIALERLGRFDAAITTADPLTRIPGWENRALELIAQASRAAGRLDEALAAYRQAQAYGVTATAYSNYLLTLLSSPSLEPVAALAEHRKINRFFANVVPLPLQGVRKPRPQRIGFLSADLRQHVVAFFVEQLFARLAAQGLQVYGYPACDPRLEDGFSARMRAACSGWQSVHGLSAEAAAQRIAHDGIDILIDLSGHSAGNRIDILAHKPAPVIATWLGYLGTTGLDAVDFRIVDGYTDPPGLTEAHHSEQLVRLAHTQWCYLPMPSHPAVTPLPAQRGAPLTFAALNSFAKASEAAVRLWAQLLARVPGSRLLVAGIPPGQPRQWITEEMLRNQVEPQRLEFLGRTPLEDYMALFARIDIALDSFPYTGGTTTCDALYMGVPVLTLAGGHSVARSGVSLLSNVGLPEWVAHSPDAFLAIGQHMASDIPALARLRAGLRQRFMASPLGDQALFAQDFAAALDEMWRRKGLAG